MMTASEQIARTAGHIRNHWDPALFTPAAGDPVPVKVHVSKETDFQPRGLEAQTWAPKPTLEYLLSDIGREVDDGETFTMDADGTVYTVVNGDDLENDGVFVKVNVK